MKSLSRIILAAVTILGINMTAHAQYYQLANQMTNMISAAVTGGLNYRGYVEASYIGGIGNKKASFGEISTTQGFKYGSMFYMGVGAGIDYMSTSVSDNGYKPTGNTTTSAAMVPLFTDFRLNFGAPANTGFFIDLRLGCAFYIGNKYILVGDGYISNSQSFYLRPGVGVRIPVSSNSDKYAFCLTASYQLLTSSYWYNPSNSNSVTLNGIGFSAAFEW